MPLTSPIPVRLPGELIARLDVAADKIGNTRAGLIRFCVETWLRHFEKRGMATMPPDWEEILMSFDGRRISHADRARRLAAQPSSRIRTKTVDDIAVELLRQAVEKKPKKA